MLKRNYLWVILILILITSLSVYLFYKERGNDSLQAEEIIEESEEFVEVEEAPVKIEQGIVSGIKDGQKEWEIEAGKISLGKDRKNTIFEEIKKAIIYKDDKPNLNIKAKKCIADMKSKSMELVEDVIIETEEGDILKGERFFWNSEEETLSSMDPVELMVKENNITADWLTSDVELNKLELQGNVKVTFEIH
ncbi:MAG: LPS export ABC transporter periplasmic protein LptC [Candidatus Caldatribacteriota bacterium]|nr:LPS export ABC transporter periplasmic protein LptC [Candidatus Caldatribacteriota bacterium]